MKQFLLIFLSIIAIDRLSAQTLGPNSGSTFSTSSIAGSEQTWMNESNLGASDDTYATFNNLPNPAGTYTDYIVITGFGFDVPFGSVIAGISVDIERSDPNQLTSDYSIRLVKNAEFSAGDRSTGMAWPAGDTYQTYGGSTDMWGDSWSYKDVTNGSFGVAIAVQRRTTDAGVTTGRIDHVRITLHFQYFFTLPVKLLSFAAVKNNNAVQVKWTTTEESSIDHYEVERSSNGRDFYSLGHVNSRNSTVNTSYTYTDNTPVKGVSWYRLKIVETNGTSKYSAVAMIRMDETGKNNLYPTVVNQGQTIPISNPGTQPLQVKIFNGSGQLVTSLSTSLGQVPASSVKAAGLYYYTITDTKGIQTGSGRIIVQ